MISYMTNKFGLLLVAVAATVGSVAAGGGLFTYYETPLFSRQGNKAMVMAQHAAVGVGPSQWPNLIFPLEVVPTGNQCGGIGQSTGFGQSPVVVPAKTRDTCDADLTGYHFEGGTCTWADLEFKVVVNGVMVGVKHHAHCSLGRMKTPSNKDTWYKAVQLHIHTSSEHTVDGKYHPAELHVLHKEDKHDEQHHNEDSHHRRTAEDPHAVHQESADETFAMFGMFIDHNDQNSTQDNPVFEHFLKGWDAASRQAHEFCAVHPDGSGNWTSNSVLGSRQMKQLCPAVAVGIMPDQVVFDDYTGLPKNQLADSLGDEIMQDQIPNIYTALGASDAGMYSYRGGLTTPPCTESVHWTLVDTPMKASKAQIDRLYELILCFVEISTCKHATIANEAGYTNRPVQALQGRVVTHRCPGGPLSTTVLEDPLPPQYEYVETQTRRCVLGGDGGPLGMCWVAHYHNHFAMLFPWFVMAMGLVVFYLLTRYCHWFPYTATMFLLGIFMGVAIVRLELTDQLSSSIRMWENIDAHTLLLAFLPGLLFRDAYCSNVFLFMKALPQSLLLAFPAVLAGTCMTALVGYYILPYGWSWPFCMTFGAILSATDPVAVSALLGEVGAPPRLRTHISGESMINDGSAIVFFTIFSQIFLYELDIPGVGTDIDIATGFALFFRMSLGAVAVGVAFSLALLFLVYLLNKRFNYEESIVQVTATVTTAYLSYYVAEAVFGMSGVISVVTCGIMTKFVASSIFNDPDMMEKFWVMLEHILNSLLFVLGGVVWGTVISNADPDRLDFTFTAEDWGYLGIVYLLAMLIRGILIFGFYPIFSRIGLKSDIKEATFMVWGGLRGAVGIALAIALDKEMIHDTFPTDPRRKYTSQLFGLTGGIAFLTLVINGTLAGPILRKLGLADVGEARQKVVQRYRAVIKLRMLSDLIEHLGHSRFSGVEFAVIKKHISFFDDLTADQIRYSVKHNKEFTSLLHYKEPNLASMKPFMTEEEFEDITAISKINMGARLRAVVSMASIASMSSRASMNLEDSQRRTLKHSPKLDYSVRTMRKEIHNDDVEKEDAIELRKVFIELLTSAYEDQFNSGEIDVRDSILVFSLKASLEVTADLVTQGHPLNDWHAVTKASKIVDFNKSYCGSGKGGDVEGGDKNGHGTNKRQAKRQAKKTRALVKRVVAFIEAHQRAQQAFKDGYCNGQMMSETEVLIIEESEEQVTIAQEALLGCGQGDMNVHVAHVLCSILLSKAADLVGSITQKGLLREQEAEEYLHAIEHDLTRVEKCYGDRCDHGHHGHGHGHGSSLGHGSGHTSVVAGKSDSLEKTGEASSDSSDHSPPATPSPPVQKNASFFPLPEDDDDDDFGLNLSDSEEQEEIVFTPAQPTKLAFPKEDDTLEDGDVWA